MTMGGFYRPRSAEAVAAEALTLLPPGWIWPASDEGGRPSVLAATLRPVSAAFAEIEALAATLVDEVDPSTATYAIDDYERVLGADPCGRDTALMTLADRRRLAHQRWTARGGASIAYFTAFAARRGAAITISENIVSIADEVVSGDELVDFPEQFVWTVSLAIIGETLFAADEGVAGDRLYDLALADVECDIRRLKPAHTEVVFRYV